MAKDDRKIVQLDDYRRPGTSTPPSPISDAELQTILNRLQKKGVIDKIVKEVEGLPTSDLRAEVRRIART